MPVFLPLPSVEETQKYKNSENVIELLFNSKDPMLVHSFVGKFGFSITANEDSGMRLKQKL